MKDTQMTIKFDLYNLIALLGIFFIGYGMWNIKSFILMLVVSIVISTFIEDFVKRWEKYKFPRIFSVFLFYITMLIIIFGIIIFLVPVLIKEVGTLSQFFPEVSKYVNLSFLYEQFDGFSNGVSFVDKIKHIPLEKLFSIISLFFGGLFNLIVVFIISFYLSVLEHGLDRVLCIFTPKKYENIILNIWHNTQKKIGGWFRGQLIVAAILTIITYIGLSIMQIPYALLLALLAGLLGLVPYGIFLALLPSVGIAIIHNGWKSGLIVFIFYMLVQQILDYGVQPAIFRKMTGIPPLLVILSVIIGAKLFGFAGLIIAIPLALLGIEIVNEIEKEKEKI